jgi:hypothetical protein
MFYIQDMGFYEEMKVSIMKYLFKWMKNEKGGDNIDKGMPKDEKNVDGCNFMDQLTVSHKPGGCLKDVKPSGKSEKGNRA